MFQSTASRRHFSSDARTAIQKIWLRLGPDCIGVSAQKIAKRGGESDICNVEVGESCGSEIVDIRLSDARGVDRDLLGVCQHGDLLVRKRRQYLRYRFVCLLFNRCSPP